MMNRSESALARVSQQLSRLEKRDWELWAIVSLAGILVTVGLLALLLPGAFKSDTIHFEITVSRQLAIGLFILLAFLNTYLVTKRFEVRRLREQLISSTLQNQVTEQQSFTDPLTEIYNRRSLDTIAGQFISQARRRAGRLSFLMVDADDFKQINTRFGHLTGDFVLAEIAGTEACAPPGAPVEKKAVRSLVSVASCSTASPETVSGYVQVFLPE